jgi:hypothetical protein
MVAALILVLCAALARIKITAVHLATLVVLLTKPVKKIWTNFQLLFYRRNRRLKRTTSKVFDARSFLILYRGC